jgi:hypothetical protein
VERIRRRFASPAAGVVLAVGLTVVVLVETWPVLQLSPVWSEPPPLYATLGPESGAVLFEYPMYPNPDEIHRNLPYLYFSTWHWTRMVNGYSGFVPQSYYDLAAGTAGFPLEGSVAYLQHAGVTHVTLNCALWDTNACDITMRRLDADRRFRLIKDTRWNGAPARLYELAR